MGPLTADHWYVFVADYVDRATELCVDRTLDVSTVAVAHRMSFYSWIRVARRRFVVRRTDCKRRHPTQMMMFGIDEAVARLFVKDSARFPKDSDVTHAAGIDALLPGSSIQEFAFEPCGYSMNGLLYDAYWTIHITPESHCSYASFETNIRMTNFGPLVKAVLAIFRPKRFTMTLFADTHGAAGLRETPFQQVIAVPVVESSSPSVSGPCVVLSHDIDGAPVIAYAGGSVPDRATQASNDSNSPNAAADVAAADFPPPTSLRRVASSSGVPGKGSVMTYVMSAKSHTEFLGEYFSVLGNFVCVHTSGRGEGGPAEVLASSAVPVAASSSLSNPRVKYVVARSARNVLTKGRTSSM